MLAVEFETHVENGRKQSEMNGRKMDFVNILEDVNIVEPFCL